MSIRVEDRIHGACIAEIVLHIGKAFPEIRISLTEGADRSSHRLLVLDQASNKTLSIGLYLKYSRSRRSPWDYSFDIEHQKEMAALFNSCGEVFTIFINDEDGYACLDHQELKTVLDEHFDEVEWVRVSRKINQSYRISGKDGAHERALPRNSFPGKIATHISKRLDKGLPQTVTNQAADDLT